MRFKGRYIATVAFCTWWYFQWQIGRATYQSREYLLESVGKGCSQKINLGLGFRRSCGFDSLCQICQICQRLGPRCRYIFDLRLAKTSIGVTLALDSVCNLPCADCRLAWPTCGGQSYGGLPHLPHGTLPWRKCLETWEALLIRKMTYHKKKDSPWLIGAFIYIIYDICIILIDFSLRRDDWMDVAILSTDPALTFGSSAEQIVHSARLRQTRWDYGVLHGSTV